MNGVVNLKESLNDSDFNKLLNGFKIYDELFCDNTIVYTYKKGNEINELSVFFTKSNFKHLCGVEYVNNNNANVFYNRLKNHQIHKKQIQYKNSFTKLKLNVLPYLDCLLDPEKIRITLRSNLLHLNFDNLIKSKKAILAIACDKEPHKCTSYPKSLINLKNTQISQKSFQVTEIKIIN